jgi:hypothetical protein
MCATSVIKKLSKVNTHQCGHLACTIYLFGRFDPTTRLLVSYHFIQRPHRQRGEASIQWPRINHFLSMPYGEWRRGLVVSSPPAIVES